MDPADDQTGEHGSHGDAAERGRGADTITDEKMEHVARRAHLDRSLRDRRVPHWPRAVLVTPLSGLRRTRLGRRGGLKPEPLLQLRNKPTECVFDARRIVV